MNKTLISTEINKTNLNQILNFKSNNLWEQSSQALAQDIAQQLLTEQSTIVGLDIYNVCNSIDAFKAFTVTNSNIVKTYHNMPTAILKQLLTIITARIVN